MSQSKTKNAAEDLMASLLEELNLSDENSKLNLQLNSHMDSPLDLSSDADDVSVLSTHGLDEESDELNMSSVLNTSFESDDLLSLDLHEDPKSSVAEVKTNLTEQTIPIASTDATAVTVPVAPINGNNSSVGLGDGEKTVAIAGYTNRNDQSHDNNVKVSVGQSRGAFSSGYAAWGNSDSQLAQADNLRIAQEKILEIENENEKLRMQNEELIAASEIVRERADLLTAQVQEFKNDRDSLEQSFKNEIQLIRNQVHRKDNELQKAQMKVDELDSRLKFDMKKIRIRERELENRLELIRAEKNALVKSKDEQILDLRRKMDQVQLEVESYRQKCVDLNKVLGTNQDSFKRTTRALRLAMANLELQDENKIPLKKAD